MSHRLLSRLASASLVGASGLASSLAFAHEGHGLEAASHWHATDVFGPVVGAVAIGIALWFTRGGK